MCVCVEESESMCVWERERECVGESVGERMCVCERVCV